MEEEVSDNIADIDLDGSVAHFMGRLREHLDLMQSPGDPEITDELIENPPPWLDYRMRCIKKQPGFWRNLDPIPLGLRVVAVIRRVGYRLNTLTKGPRRTTSAWTEKVEWSHEHLPDAMVTVTEDKGLVYGKVLFDDYPDYITGWLKWRKRGLVLMLDQPWNQGFEHPNVIRVTGTPENMQQIRAALEARIAQ